MPDKNPDVLQGTACLLDAAEVTNLIIPAAKVVARSLAGMIGAGINSKSWLTHSLG